MKPHVRSYEHAGASPPPFSPSAITTFPQEFIDPAAGCLLAAALPGPEETDDEEEEDEEEKEDDEDDPGHEGYSE